MTAAQRAGMKCIGYVANGAGGEYPAEVVVSSLAEITREMIVKLE
ncbi:MAG: hypothetical protein AABX13_01690 [Nanoarchaeota archaeon]